MNGRDILRFRLHSQHLTAKRFTDAGDLIDHLGALQGQDYNGGKWSIGVRLGNTTDAGIEAAIEAKHIVRTWPMRGTLHYVSARHVRWMQKLLCPRVIANAARRHRQLELDEGTMSRGRRAITGALKGRRLTRTEALAALDRAGIATRDQRGYHLLWWIAQTGYICFGPSRGRQPTFVLMDEWLPATPDRSREDSLLELARIYFRAHGPATLQDYAWWTGLVAADARASLEMAEPGLRRVSSGSVTMWMADAPEEPPPVDGLLLLPAFDEYLLGYTDRSAMVGAESARSVQPGNGMFRPVIVDAGRVIGTWRRAVRKSRLIITAEPFRPLTRKQAAALESAAARHGDYAGSTVSVVM